MGALIVVFYDNGGTFTGLGALIVVFYDNGGTFPGLGALIVVFYDNGWTFPGMGALRRYSPSSLPNRSRRYAPGIAEAGRAFCPPRQASPSFLP
jgi:hypothetical protein